MMMMDKLDWKQILMLAYVYFHDGCISVDISGDLRITYSHVSRFLHLLASEGLIVYGVKTGRETPFVLSDSGRELAFRCYNLVGVLESINGGKS
jgi:DNA-binding MarR family transcriptional regulator